MERMKLKRFLVLFMLIIVTVISLGSQANSSTQSLCQVNEIDTTAISLWEDDSLELQVEATKDSIKESLVQEVTEYINKQSPKAYETIPENLVEAGLENNIDICFMMAQTELETNFGTTGAGRPTSRRSMFGIIGKKYKTYEDAIDSYVNLLTTRYLGRGKTEQSLMKNYVSHSGHRYAGSRKYELHLSKTYKLICQQTNIRKLQTQYYLL